MPKSAEGPFEDLIAKRLLARAEDEVPGVAGETKTKPELQKTSPPALPSKDVKLEKNLASLGFFTPSSKRIKTEKAKVIRFTKTIDGKKVEATATIVPAAIYGLPITADQDKYLALQKIVTDVHQQEGRVKNPIGFTSAELLRLLHDYRDSGKNYKDIYEWLNLMSATTIISEGVVYYAGKKRFATDRFHVFDRAVTFGKELEPGKIADKNYVWLSEWQLENINNNHLIPVDLEAYTQLTKHIAKALVPLLQIWLHATREEGSFEKRYDHLCEILSIRQYRHLSDIKRFFGSSLDELKAHGYLADWKIERTSDRKGFKVIFYHGDKFHSDQRRRLAQKEAAAGAAAPSAQPLERAPVAPGQGIDPVILAEMTKRGIPDSRARDLLSRIRKDQYVLDQLEWGDYLISQSEPGKFYNPTGFFIHLISQNVTPPDTFESTRKWILRKKAQEEHNRALAEESRRFLAYEQYKKDKLDEYIKANYTGEQYQELLNTKKAELRETQKKLFRSWPDTSITSYAERDIREQIARAIPFLSYEAFIDE